MHIQASFFIDVNLQWKELRKIEKIWLAVEGTTYRGRCKSLLCAEITLTFEGFLGCCPIILCSVSGSHTTALNGFKRVIILYWTSQSMAWLVPASIITRLNPFNAVVCDPETEHKIWWQRGRLLIYFSVEH